LTFTGILIKPRSLEPLKAQTKARLYEKYKQFKSLKVGVYVSCNMDSFIEKSAIAIARKFGGRKKNFTGQHFWARGYHVSTVGRDEETTIRQYIRKHEDEDRRLDQQLDLFE
jgi:Ni/Co efflux regulator RcnB